MSCLCNHLTLFGGSIIVHPNPIDYDKVWIGLKDIKNNSAILATMITVFLLFLLVLIWARRADTREINLQVRRPILH